MDSESDPVPIPITDVFDLHTVPPRDIVPIVEEYLAEAHRLGLRALRIIHGRGIGVQREAVRAARRAFAGPWSRVTPYERQQLLLKLADLVERRLPSGPIAGEL
jgi:hypothetical protein